MFNYCLTCQNQLKYLPVYFETVHAAASSEAYIARCFHVFIDQLSLFLTGLKKADHLFIQSGSAYFCCNRLNKRKTACFAIRYHFTTHFITYTE